MPKPVVIDVSHELGLTEAKRRLRTGFGRIREQFGVGAVALEERWEGERLDFTARVPGQTIGGCVYVMEKSVRIELNLPWALGLLANKLQDQVRRAGTLLLEKK